MSKKCSRVAFSIKRDGVSHVFENAFAFIHTLSFFLKIMVQLVISRIKDFTKILKLCKKGIKNFGMEGMICDDSGCCTVMIQLIRTNGNRVPHILKFLS